MLATVAMLSGANNIPMSAAERIAMKIVASFPEKSFEWLLWHDRKLLKCFFRTLFANLVSFTSIIIRQIWLVFRHPPILKINIIWINLFIDNFVCQRSTSFLASKAILERIS
eukprot:TRINITY_DN3433_c0_g1_i1.p2 TRINITY_DN3433_c0_g1~~TRINITY_DN3433_c0_g1_i1.p2  ORF type:complete len:112 (-),score=1.31 TRINITY_DN3433_c0_g1_i1:80-415(-)